MPAQLFRAKTIDSLLRRYQGYTLSTLMNESSELLQIAVLATIEDGADG